MQIFITGGTGYVGRVIVEHLVRAGHQVRGLARSERAAQRLEALGAGPLPGSLTDIDALVEGARRSDAVIHAAVDYSMTSESQDVELAAVRALVSGAQQARASSPIPVVYTSTALVYGLSPVADTREDAVLPAVSAQPVKARAERIVIDAEASTGIVIRPGLVYGRGGSGLITGLIAAAATRGTAMYIGDGSNAWSTVHVDDLAALYVAVLEHPAAGIYNAAGDNTFTFREFAEATARLTGADISSVPLEAAEQSLGVQAHVLSTTSLLSSEKARATFEWTPTHRSFAEELATGGYAVPPVA